MSYLDNLSQEERSELTEINISIETLYEQAKNKFPNQHPDGDFAEAELKIQNKIFTSNCDFTGDFACHLYFDNCHFQNQSIFFKASFKKITFRNCFFEDELRIAETVEFNDEFNFITLTVRKTVFINGGIYKTCHWSMTNNGSLIMNQGKFEELIIGYWGGALFKEVNLNVGKITGQIKVSGFQTKIEWLRIFQSSNDLLLAIEDISVNCFSVYRFRNEKSFRIFNIKAFKSQHATEFFYWRILFGKS